MYFFLNTRVRAAMPIPIMENGTSVNMLKNVCENLSSSVACELFAKSHNSSVMPTTARPETRMIGR